MSEHDDGPVTARLSISWGEDDPLKPKRDAEVDYAAVQRVSHSYAYALGVDLSTGHLRGEPAGVRALWDEHGTMAFHLHADDIESAAFRAQLRQLGEKLLEEAGPPDLLDGAG